METNDQAPVLETGGRCELTITDIAFGGAGVGRIGEFVVFVPFVALGERVEVELVRVKKRFAHARLLNLIVSSPARVEPGCRYYGECGGCQYQHLEYPVQLEVKEKQIKDLLQRLAGLDPAAVRPIVPCPRTYGYRNRILVRSQWNKPKQSLVVGFLRHDNRWVVDVEECAIAEPVLNTQLTEVRKNPPPKGGLKVGLRVQAEGWEVPPDSFFQNNFYLLPQLVEVVRDRVRDAGTRHLIDVYCGVGFFGIELSGVVESFVGVECDRRAVSAARRNAEKRECRNGEFVSGNAEEILPDLVARYEPARTTVILDPPRAGCRPEAVDTLRTARPAQILYVSCHPATLARDLKALCAEGLYRVDRVIPLDMFPQTQHIECVADLRLEAAAASESAAANP